MSTKLLYHAFGLRGYDYVSTQYHGGALTFTVRQKPKALICPACGSKRVLRKGGIRRQLRTIPIGFRPTWICAIIQRVGCPACRAIRRVELGMARARRSYTQAFERFALGLPLHMTIKDVAMVTGIRWDVITEIQYRSLKRRFAKPRPKHLKRSLWKKFSSEKAIAI